MYMASTHDFHSVYGPYNPLYRAQSVPKEDGGFRESRPAAQVKHRFLFISTLAESVLERFPQGSLPFVLPKGSTYHFSTWVVVQIMVPFWVP